MITKTATTFIISNHLGTVGVIIIIIIITIMITITEQSVMLTLNYSPNVNIVAIDIYICFSKDVQ